jgi:hypothetical protein
MATPEAKAHVSALFKQLEPDTVKAQAGREVLAEYEGNCRRILASRISASAKADLCDQEHDLLEARLCNIVEPMFTMHEGHLRANGYPTPPEDVALQRALVTAGATTYVLAQVLTAWNGVDPIGFVQRGKGSAKTLLEAVTLAKRYLSGLGVSLDS